MKRQIHSLRFYTAVLLAMLMLLFSVLVIYNNYSAFLLLRKKVYRNTEDKVVLYEKQLTEILKSTETYLFTTAYNNSDLHTVKSSSLDAVKWYTAAYHLQSDFTNALSIYTADCFSCYLPSINHFISREGSLQSMERSFRAEQLYRLSNDTLNTLSWELTEIEGQYILSRTVRVKDAYVSAWVLLDTLLNTLVDSSDPDNRLYFTTAEGQLLQTGTKDWYITPPAQRTSPYAYDRIDDKKVIPVSLPLTHTQLYLTTLVSSSELSDSQTSMTHIILAVSAGFMAIWLVLFFALRRWILSPISSLISGINRLRSGDLETFVPPSRQLDEFRNMTTSFNDMVREIKDLKIDAYEHKLAQQRLEAQFLKQQITPHFMINCLNTACQLTENDHTDLARQILKSLSTHLRYTLSSGAVVPLGDELKLVRNYVEMSSIRYPGCLKLIIQCPETLYDAKVVPMLILNFIENTIKHEVVMGKILEMHISIDDTNDSRMHLCIWDSGRGFSPDMLKILEQMEVRIKEEQEHIGIVNVILRARQNFDNPVFRFSNRPGAGAQIDIYIPLLPFDSPAIQ